MNPGVSQKDDHPVVCLAWSDAVEYGKWLSKKTGHAVSLAYGSGVGVCLSGRNPAPV